MTGSGWTIATATKIQPVSGSKPRRASSNVAQWIARDRGRLIPREKAFARLPAAFGLTITCCHSRAISALTWRSTQERSTQLCDCSGRISLISSTSPSLAGVDPDGPRLVYGRGQIGDLSP